MVETDYERLAAVRNGTMTGRRCGKTFSACHYAADYLLGEVDRPGTQFAVWYIFRWNYINHILSMLYGVLVERGAQDIKINRRTGIVKVGERELRFIRTDDEERRYCLPRNTYYVLDSSYA